MDIDTTPIDIEAVLNGFVTCGLWLSHTEEDDDRGENLDEFAEMQDITPHAMQEMREECIEFVRYNLADLLACAPVHDRGEWSYSEQVGHDLWLTRGRHGAGFWDRGYGDAGDRLSEACRPYGEPNLWADENGQVHYGF